MTAIAVDSANPKAAFAAYSGFSCPGVNGCDGLGHVFFTNNSGASWLQVDGNLPDVPVNDIVIDPTDATDNTIYIATDSGVYASANATAGGATTWSVLQSGLPNSQVLALRLRNTSRTLVAGTHGRGLWSLLLPNLPSLRADGAEPDSGHRRFRIVSADGYRQWVHGAIRDQFQRHRAAHYFCQCDEPDGDGARARVELRRRSAGDGFRSGAGLDEYADVQFRRRGVRFFFWRDGSGEQHHERRWDVQATR